MSTDKITISKHELECLREHLDQAMRIFQSLGIDTGGVGITPPDKAKKKRVPFAKGVQNYEKLLMSGKKRTLPEHLRKNKKATR